MDRYYTFMLIPEKDRKIFSFRIPTIIFRSFLFLIVVFVIMIGVLIYDYRQILNQVYENKHLTLENQKLRDQLNIFQMKINTLTSDIERIHTFEQKLKTITGIEDSLYHTSFFEEEEADQSDNKDDRLNVDKLSKPYEKEETPFSFNFEEIKKKDDYRNLKDLYHQQLIESFGVPTNYIYSKAWSKLTKQSISLAGQFATFDFKYNKLKNLVHNLEVSIHLLDQFLLDQESYLKSTPTILPTSGWITSYYGVRKSPYSGRYKIHEGLDIGANIGTAVIAPADGIVIYAGHKPGFGKFVHIDHGYGIETIYGHNDSIKTRYGSKVKRGDLIAKVGNTGLSTGPHLHYEVRVNGVPVDPLYFILD